MTADGVNAHRLGESDEVGVHHARVRISRIIEQIYVTRRSGHITAPGTNERQTLPLLHHALELVVQDDDLHADAELRGRLELHCRHAERRITVDVDDSFVGCADLGTDS